MTGRWRPLPAALDQEVAYLVGVLRELKDRSGLSLSALAARTAYSKSSWERYLNGVKLPPRHAVEELARLAGEPPDRLVALWERAEARWSGRAAAPRAPAPDTSVTASPPGADERTGTGHSTHPRRRAGWVFTAAATCIAAAALAMAARLFGVHGVPAPADSTTGPPAMPLCRGTDCAGRDPLGMGCGIDAASFAEALVDGTHLELRISRQCGAAWARVSYSRIGDRVTVVTRDGRTQVATVPDQGATQRYVPTRMVTAGAHADLRACLERAGRSTCTPWGADQPVPVRAPGGRSVTPAG